MNEWKIQNHGSQCVQCGKSFEDRESCRTLLVEEDEELQRYDICLNCWKASGGEISPEQGTLISTWLGQYRKPPPRSREAIHKDQAEQILLQLVTERETYPAHPGTLYILSAMLERKRTLKLRDTVHRDRKRLFVYEHTGSGDVFTIEDVKLSTDQWTTVYQEVSGVLSAGLNYWNSPETDSDGESENSEHEHDDVSSAEQGDHDETGEYGESVQTDPVSPDDGTEHEAQEPGRPGQPGGGDFDAGGEPGAGDSGREG